MERSLRAAHELARDRKTNKKGVPTNPFELALLYELSESFIVGMPLFLQKGVFRALARVARWRGYDPEFSRYTKPDGGVAEVRTHAPSGMGRRTLMTLTAMLVLLLLPRRRSHRSGRN